MTLRQHVLQLFCTDRCAQYHMIAQSKQATIVHSGKERRKAAERATGYSKLIDKYLNTNFKVSSVGEFYFSFVIEIRARSYLAEVGSIRRICGLILRIERFVHRSSGRCCSTVQETMCRESTRPDCVYAFELCILWMLGWLLGILPLLIDIFHFPW